MKKIWFFLACALVGCGAAFLIYDAWFARCYGEHLLDVAGVTEDGLILAWPTGEKPAWANVPVYVYALYLWLLALLALRLSKAGRPPYAARTLRGTE